MKKHLFIMCSVMLMLSSCTSIRKTSTTASIDNQVYQYPTVADLVVKEKVESTVTWNFVPFHFNEPTFEQAKGNLIAEMIKEHGADILLEPQVIFEKISFGPRTLTVTGYPASFKDFRPASSKDLEALEVTKSLPENQRTVYNVGGIKGFFNRLF